MKDLDTLDLITTDELIAELKRRHTDLLIVLEKDHPTKANAIYTVDYAGNFNSAIGLCDIGKWLLRDMLDDANNDDDEDDDLNNADDRID